MSDRQDGLGLIVMSRVEKDTSPSCGVDDYVNTWNDFYDAANLKETYDFLSSHGQSSFTGRQGLQEISPGNLTQRSAAWSPLEVTDSIRPRSGSAYSSSGGVIRSLTVDTIPAVMEFRLCEMTSSLRSSLSCLADSSLEESRVLEDCIDNIEQVSSVRLDVTQKIIDITLQLDGLESKEY